MRLPHLSMNGHHISEFLGQSTEKKQQYWIHVNLLMTLLNTVYASTSYRYYSVLLWTKSLSHNHPCHKRTVVTKALLSQKHLCHISTVVTQASLPHKHCYHLSTLVTQAMLSNKHNYHTSITDIQVQLSHKHLCHKSTVVTQATLSHKHIYYTSTLVTQALLSQKTLLLKRGQERECTKCDMTLDSVDLKAEYTVTHFALL